MVNPPDDARGAALLLSLLVRATLGLGALLAAWVVVSVSAAVVSRRLLGSPQAWTIEVAEYALLFMAFLGAAAVARGDGHVRMEVIDELASPRLKKALAIASDALSLAITAVLFGASAWITIDSFIAGTPTAKILPLPRWVPLSIMPIGSALLALQLLHNLRSRLRDPEGPPSEGVHMADPTD